MILSEILTAIIGAYITYKLEKIDKRQDKIEIDLELIKHSIPKRFGDER